jgi:hypothetical protein
MTKKALLILPCLVIALAFMGCSAGGEDGGKTSSVWSWEPDPNDEALARGYVSTIADPALLATYADGLTVGLEPVSQDLFLSRDVVVTTPGNGIVAASTLAPSTSMSYVQAPQVRARDMGNGTIEVSRGDQVAYLTTFEHNGETKTQTTSSRGVVTINGENTFPTLLTLSGSAKALILSDGTVSLVE